MILSTTYCDYEASEVPAAELGELLLQAFQAWPENTFKPEEGHAGWRLVVCVPTGTLAYVVRSVEA